MKKKTFGNLFVLLGQLLVVAALLLTGYNMYDSRRAGEAATNVRDQLAEQIETQIQAEQDARDEAGEGGSEGDVPGSIDPSEVDPSIMPEITDGSLFPEEQPPMESYVYMVDGYEYIGIVDVPALGISLPIMADWDYTRLKISPCRYTGTPYNDDLVIAGHNYPSHFSPLKWVDIGTDVYFTTMDGVQFHYTVSNRETVQPYSVAEMIENDNNSESTRDWDLTLFTYNTGGQTRCAVRCMRVE